MQIDHCNPVFIFFPVMLKRLFFGIKEYTTFISTHMYRCMPKILCVNIAEERKDEISFLQIQLKHKTFEIRLCSLDACTLFIHGLTHEHTCKSQRSEEQLRGGKL